MAMTFLRDGAKSGILKIFLMGLLVLAAGGLVLTDVGGFFRGGIGRTDVAKAGNTKIGIQSFDRRVRRNLRQLGMSAEEAYKLGHINQMLASEIHSEIMIQSAGDMGIAIGQDRIAQEIADLVRPLVQDGQTPQNVLDNILINQGLTERDFVVSLQRESAAGVLRQALKAGFAAQNPYLIDDLYLYQNEQRNIDLLVFPHESFKDVKEPTEEQLRSLYGKTKESYALPETRILVLGILDTKNLKGTVQVSDEEVKSEYEANLDAFYVSERRTLEQSILKEESAARNVIARIKEGADMKAAIEAVTGDISSYLDKQEFEKDGLLDEIKSIAFEGEPRLLDEPVQTALGWHVIKVHDIEDGYTKPFEEIEDKLKQEILREKSVDHLYALSGEIDDLLASGAPFEDVVNELNLSTERLEGIDTFGLNSDQEDALKAYADDRDIILETGFELFEGEASPVLEFQDGRFVTVLVEKVTEKSYKPYEEVSAHIKEKWIKDNRALENRVMVSTLMSHLSAEENASLEQIDMGREDISIQSIDGLARTEVPVSPLTAQSLNFIFKAPVGSYIQLSLPDSVAIAHIKSAKLPETMDEDAVRIFAEGINAGMENEAVQSYMIAKQEKYKVRINQTLLDQVYAEGRTQLY